MADTRDEMYKTCRWCKHSMCIGSGLGGEPTFVCQNERAFDAAADSSVDFTGFVEDGYLSEAIKEGFNGFDTNFLEDALIESRVSKKRIKEILKIFHDELEGALINWTESIDDSVFKALKNFDFESEDGVIITNPHDFCCKYFT